MNAYYWKIEEGFHLHILPVFANTKPHEMYIFKHRKDNLEIEFVKRASNNYIDIVQSGFHFAGTDQNRQG